MTADEIITQFESLVDDSLDITTELFLLNEAKDSIESDRTWAILTALDTSQTVSLGDTFQTPKTLPSDFALPSPRGIYVNGDLNIYQQVPMEGQIDFQSITYAYFIDLFNKKYYLCGNPGVSGNIQFFYRRYSPALKLATDGGLPWIFPTRFHPVLVYEMAMKYFAADQGDKGKSWDDRWTSFANRIKENMISWDDDMQTIALQNEITLGGRDLNGFPNIIDMNQGRSGNMFG